MAMKGRRKNGRMNTRSVSGKEKLAFVIALIPAIAVAILVRIGVSGTKFSRFSGLACVIAALIVGAIAEYLAGKIARKVK